MKYSKNARAERLMGLRPTGDVLFDQPFDQPFELDYHCPVCKYEHTVDGDYDERLQWSEYNGFVWCSRCNRDYPSCLCLPDPVKATGIFLDTVEDAVKRHTTPTGSK